MELNVHVVAIDPGNMDVCGSGHFRDFLERRFFRDVKEFEKDECRVSRLTRANCESISCM